MSPSTWNRERRAALFNEIPSGIVVIDRGRNIVDHNRAFAGLFGEGKGRPCYEVLRGRTDVCPVCPRRRPSKRAPSRCWSRSAATRTAARSTT